LDIASFFSVILRTARLKADGLTAERDKTRPTYFHTLHCLLPEEYMQTGNRGQAVAAFSRLSNHGATEMPPDSKAQFVE
jgi:hypothetical protein